MILSFTTETAYLSLKLVGSLSQRRYIHQAWHLYNIILIVMVTMNTTCNFEGRLQGFLYI